MSTYENQATFLKRLRIKQGYTQLALSRLLNMPSSQQLWNIEKGMCPIPAKIVIPLSKIFGINPVRFWDVYCLDMKKQWLKKTGIKRGN